MEHTRLNNISPSLHIDERTFTRNAQRIHSYATRHDLTVRPTIKTHRSSYLYQRQRELCRTDSFEIARLTDVTVLNKNDALNLSFGYPIAERSLAEALGAAIKGHSLRLVITHTDHCDIIESLATISGGEKTPCLIAYDLGLNRIGLQSPARLQTLIARVKNSKTLRFEGLQLYLGSLEQSEQELGKTQKLLADARDAMRTVGHTSPLLSFASSSSLFDAHMLDGVTELRVGGAFFYDGYYLYNKKCSVEDCAVTIEACVIDTNTQGAVLNCGTKQLGGKALTIENQPCLGFEKNDINSRISRCFEECCILESARSLKIGQYVNIIPVNSSVAINQFHSFILRSDDGSERLSPISAHGTLEILTGNT